MSAVIQPYLQGGRYQSDNGKLPTQKVDMSMVREGLDNFVIKLWLDGLIFTDLVKGMYYRNEDGIDMKDVAYQMHNAVVMDTVSSVICSIVDHVECDDDTFADLFQEKYRGEYTLVFPSSIQPPKSTSPVISYDNVPYYREEGDKLFMIPFYDRSQVELLGPVEVERDGGRVTGWTVVLPKEIRGTVFKYRRADPA